MHDFGHCRVAGCIGEDRRLEDRTGGLSLGVGILALGALLAGAPAQPTAAASPAPVSRPASAAASPASATRTVAAPASTLGRSGGARAAVSRASATRDQQPYLVTYVARVCDSYTDVMANKARNNIQESLRDLGPDTSYATDQQGPTRSGARSPPSSGAGR